MDAFIKNAGDPERQRFLIGVKRSMENFINDTISNGEEREAKYILKYFMENNGGAEGFSREAELTADDILSNLKNIKRGRTSQHH